jgi:hypothetical protein
MFGNFNSPNVARLNLITHEKTLLSQDTDNRQDNITHHVLHTRKTWNLEANDFND